MLIWEKKGEELEDVRMRVRREEVQSPYTKGLRGHVPHLDQVNPRHPFLPALSITAFSLQNPPLPSPVARESRCYSCFGLRPNPIWHLLLFL